MKNEPATLVSFGIFTIVSFKALFPVLAGVQWRVSTWYQLLHGGEKIISTEKKHYIAFQ